ncbi:MAG TPA: BrnT family toxin [Stellaceae bacterium]|jgi:hypothetical protein
MHPDELKHLAGFDWDDANRDKCERHGVPVASIEALFRQPIAIFPDPTHSQAETRFKAIGRTEGGRYVLMVFTLRIYGDETFIRPISARYMHAKEVEFYEEEATKIEKR